jgi:hypothetical protein
MTKLYPYELYCLIQAYRIIDKTTDEMNSDDRYNEALGETWSILHDEIIKQTGQEDVYAYIRTLNL